MFEHPRFCDEFSHLVTGHFVAKFNTLLATQFYRTDVRTDLNVLSKCQSYH